MNSCPTQTAYFTTKMNQTSHKRELILASSSPYRKMLLRRLQLEFTAVSPKLDETAWQDESATQLVKRLAMEKCRVICDKYPAAVVIGSDQLALFDNVIIGKPGTSGRAIAQLQKFSSKSVQFLTAVHVACQATGFDHAAMVTTEVNFRKLSAKEIQRYVELDRPLDCAGSFKLEAAGISLFDSITSDDPTAIIGLPLMTVCALLRKAGIAVP